MVKDFIIKLVYTKTFHFISIIVDVFCISYFFYSTFFLAEPIFILEVVVGSYLIIEYFILLSASENKWEYIKHPLAISNVLIIIGYLAAPFWNVSILRILRILRVIQIYQLIPDIRSITHRVIIWEKFLAILLHGTVLVFIISEIIFFLQNEKNADINTKFDAFYFTTNAIAKIGTDSITLVGTEGRILTVVIAILSFSIFIQLIETARETMRVRRKQARKKNRLTKKDLQEIYSEHLCTFCDIKNRDLITKMPDNPKEMKDLL